jgi:four helix bundle protein
MEKKSYRDLDIYQDALVQFHNIRKISLLFPKHELYELGSQVRRASDSTLSNIVEGYGRRRYKADFIRFLVFSQASNLEVCCLLERLIEIYPEHFDDPAGKLDMNDRLGKKLNKFIQYVDDHWKI